MGDKDDLDPASPGGNLEAPSENAITATNFGLNGRGDLPPDAEWTESPASTGLAAVAFDIGTALAFLDQCMTSHPRVAYKLGAKIKAGQKPGVDFKAVDCSGFVRETVRRATNLGTRFPDGSVVQHDWVKSRGFKTSTVASAKNQGDAVSIAFLSRDDSPSHIGHVVLVYKGKTLESHGGVGPDARPWKGQGWQAKAKVYVLGDAPTAVTS